MSAINPITRIRSAARSVLGLSNQYYEAFYKHIGGTPTRYDHKQRSYLINGYQENPDVFSVISQKAKKHAGVPYVVHRMKSDKAAAKLNNIGLQQKAFDENPAGLFKFKSLMQEAFEEEELEFPMERPNAMYTWADVFAYYGTFMGLMGNFYLYTPSPGDDSPNEGVPNQVFVMPAHLMNIVLKQYADLTDDDTPIDHYMLIEGDQYIRFEADEIIHVKYANPNFDLQGSHLYGQSPLRAALRNIQSSNEAIDNNIKMMSSGGAFGFITGKNKPLSDTQAKQVKSRLKEMDADQGRLGKIAGASSELAFTRISLTADELKPFEHLQFDQNTICNVLGWEVDLLNNNSKAAESSMGGRSKYELSEKRAVTKSIMPDNRLLEEALTYRFIRKFPGYEKAVFKFNYDDLREMQPDMKLLAEWLVLMIRNGVINREEARYALRMPLTGNAIMQEFTVESHVIPLEEALATDFNITEPRKNDKENV